MTIYTVPEAAKILRVNKNMVYKLINAGLLNCIKIGTKKIPEYEIERFLKDNLGKDLSDFDNIQSIKISESAYII